jgi:hypothetical protein
MHKAEPYATEHLVGSMSCGLVSGEKTQNRAAGGGRIHAPARVERGGNGARGALMAAKAFGFELTLAASWTVIIVALPLLTIVYYLVWKFLVRFLNEVLGIA